MQWGPQSDIWVGVPAASRLAMLHCQKFLMLGLMWPVPHLLAVESSAGRPKCFRMLQGLRFRICRRRGVAAIHIDGGQYAHLRRAHDGPRCRVSGLTSRVSCRRRGVAVVLIDGGQRGDL